MSDQLSLFEPPEDEATRHLRQARETLDAHLTRAATLAAALPPGVYFGTSSWRFPGWAGLVYPPGLSSAALSREALRYYARHPLLTTVGIDRSYYAPIPIDDLRQYADQLPDRFRCCLKAPASVTSRRAPGLGAARGGASLNPDFLSVDRLIADLLQPLAVAFLPHTGPIVLEFPPGAREEGRPAAAFFDDLDRFLEKLPPDFEYAVEIRDKALLTPAYRSLLARHGVAHTYNYWSAMPMPGAQADTVPPEELPFVVVRLLLRPGTWYEDQRDRFTPFNRLIAPDEPMRDQVVDLTMRALAKGRRVYVLVNNKAEGSSPLTIEALAARLAAALAPGA